MRSNYSTSSVALIATLLLLPIVYVGSYPLALGTVEVMYDPDIATPDEGTRMRFFRRDPYYFGDPNSLCGRVGAVGYAPLQYLDEQWRPAYWKITSATSYSSGFVLERLREVTGRINEKLFWAVVEHDFRAWHCVAIVASVRWLILGEPPANGVGAPKEHMIEPAIPVLPDDLR